MTDRRVLQQAATSINFARALEATHRAGTPAPWHEYVQMVTLTLKPEPASNPVAQLIRDHQGFSDAALILLLRNAAAEIIDLLDRLEACRTPHCDLCLYDGPYHTEECPFRVLDALNAQVPQ